jgi:hypothetical protein
MRASPLCLLPALLLGASALTAQQRGDPPRRPFLFKDARGEIAAARARGDSSVTLVVASMPGANAKAAALVAGLGGTVRYRDDDVDYLRVHVRVDSVERLVRDPLVHSVDVSISRLGRAFGLADATPAQARNESSPSTLPFVPPSGEAMDGARHDEEALAPDAPRDAAHRSLRPAE